MLFTKNTFKMMANLVMAIIATGVLFSCNPEDEEPGIGQSPGLVSVSLNVLEVENISGNRVADVTPTFSIDDFALTIYQQGTSNVIMAFGVGEIPVDPIELMEGDYTAVLDNHMDNDITVGHFSGSQDFTVVPQEQVDVDVTVDLQEIYFQFTLPDYFFITHKISVEDAAGPVAEASDATPYLEMYLPTLGAGQAYDFAVINNTSNAVIGTKSIVSDQAGSGYNISVNQLEGTSAFSFTVNPIVTVDEEFELVPTEIVGFTGAFDGANWSSTNNSSATGYAFSASQLTFDCPGGGGGFVAQITIPADGTITLDYDFVIRTAGQYGDRIAYSINGTVTNLSTAGNASGSVTIPVSQGDDFALSTWGTTQSSSYYGSFSNFIFTY